MPVWSNYRDIDKRFLYHFENNFTNNGLQGVVTLTDGGTDATAFSTSAVKFGTYSLLISYTTAGHTCLRYNTATTGLIYERSKRCTVDFWLYVGTTSGVNKVFGVLQIGSSNNASVYLKYNGSAMQIAFSYKTNASTYTTITTGEYHHIAVVRDSDTNATMYIDGSSVSSVVVDNTVNLDNRYIYIGDSNGLMDAIGYFIDELRITSAVKWSGNFTPPTQAYS